MIEIKPGPKLDQAVAKAIGLTWQDATRTKMAAWWHKDGWCYRKLPSFSKFDLNATFKVAEMAGLFFNYSLTLDETDPTHWLIEHKDDGGILARAPTQPLAICAAILKLSEEKEASMTD